MIRFLIQSKDFDKDFGYVVLLFVLAFKKLEETIERLVVGSLLSGPLIDGNETLQEFWQRHVSLYSHRFYRRLSNPPRVDSDYPARVRKPFYFHFLLFDFFFFFNISTTIWRSPVSRAQPFPADYTKPFSLTIVDSLCSGCKVCDRFFQEKGGYFYFQFVI